MITLKLQRAATTNLTLVQQVAKEHLGLDALPGYVLVVFERREQGAVFSRLVNSGESFSAGFRIPFRDLSQKYFAIAVNDSVLSYAFEHLIALDDGSEEFTLNFHLTYRVAEPRKVAEILEQDPLRQLRDEVVRVIARNCAKRKAEMFRGRFRDLERIVIDSESVRLRPYAAELGFKIISIDLDKPLPDHRRKAIDVRNSYDLSTQDLEKPIAVKQKVDDIHKAQQNRRLRAVQTDALVQGLTNVAAKIDPPEKLRKGFEVAREIARKTGAAVQPDGRSSPTSTEKEPAPSQRATGDAQTKGIDDREHTPLDSSLGDQVVERSLPDEAWKNGTARLIKMLEQAGIDRAITNRVSEDLEVVAAKYFPPTVSSNQASSTVLAELPLFDSVMCTVFAPPAAFRGANILVQVFAHLIGDSETVKRIAAKFDEQAKRLVAKSLNNEVKRASTLTFSISMPGLEIDEPVQELIWRGQPDAIQFGVSVPENFKEQEIVGTIYVSQNGVPFGHAKFLLQITDDQKTLAREQTASDKVSTWKHYKYAFISYAAVDRPEVVKRVQMLSRFHIDFFQDVLTMEPGEQWERTNYENIDKSDVFFLFWSTAARNSERVMKEIRYALGRKGPDRLAAPEIVPVIIEGPPPVPPPAELKDIHFNDRLIYFMNAQ
ncbi:MAG TPA: toll/interleukin-1 receptor domain-containing protein [Pyrinomonadaceae bacterium]|nr:toll/interleukin-1 receptor domain-containing protein [Pyrinomonadaceae bacterium]